MLACMCNTHADVAVAVRAQPVLEKVFTLSNVSAAFEHVLSGQARGKVVIDIGGGPQGEGASRFLA